MLIPTSGAREGGKKKNSSVSGGSRGIGREKKKKKEKSVTPPVTRRKREEGESSSAVVWQPPVAKGEKAIEISQKAWERERRGEAISLSRTEGEGRRAGRLTREAVPKKKGERRTLSCFF